MERYSNLRDAVLALDPVLIRTLAAFSIERHEEGLVVLFRFAFYGPRLDEPHNVEQYPDIEALLPASLDARSEIDSLEETEILGGFNAIELGPHVGDNPTDWSKWVVKTHAGSQAERIEWRNSIG